MPADVFVTVASANLIYQFWVHTRFVSTLGPLEMVLVTPMNHRVHHARNPEYIDKNYGGFFIIWDRMFGTYKAEDPDLSIDYGITRGLNSWNPLWANVHVYVDMIRDTLRSPRLGDKLRVWYGRTVFVPPGVVKSPVQAGNFYNPPLARGMKIYVFVQFLALIAVLVPMLYLPDQLGAYGVSVLFFYQLGSLVVLGWLLDADKPRLEWLRLLASLMIVAMFPLPPWLTPLLTGLVLISATAYFFVSRENQKIMDTHQNSG